MSLRARVGPPTSFELVHGCSPMGVTGLVQPENGLQALRRPKSGPGFRQRLPLFQQETKITGRQVLEKDRKVDLVLHCRDQLYDIVLLRSKSFNEDVSLVPHRGLL